MPPGQARTKKRLPAVAVLLALLATLLGTGWTAFAPAARAASLTEVTGFGTNPGNLRMFAYVPDGLPAGRPLVVAMHGCTQSAGAFDTETGWTTWADRWGFALLLPQQQSANNLNSCFNWFESADIRRGSGEALSIKQMTDRMKGDVLTDPARVHATGLSAGAAMTNVMLAAYPDVFASGAPVAGLPYACATSVAAAYTCMSPGTNLSPSAWGDKVRAAYPGYAGPWPTVSVWQGTSDTTVVPANMTETVEQWTNVHGADTTADTTDTVAGYPHAVYRDSAGRPVVETYSVTGMGHGQPVDPGTGDGQCGTAGAYILDVNLCASYRIAQFWGLSDSGTPPPGGTKTAVLPSQATNDGYVKASATGAGPAVGTLEGTYGVAVGRGADGQQNRTLLSFDTSSVPDGATVKRAYVTVTYASGSGDPWAAGNRMVLDVRSGCFGTGCATGADDWSAAASASEVAEIGRFTSGAQTSTDFAAVNEVNDTGTTQVRLRLASVPAATAYVFMKSGASATLTVEWE